MHCTVITTSKSYGISSGLTYDTGDLAVQPGMTVRVPLRNRLVEGVVIELQEKKGAEAFDVKTIHSLIGSKAMLSEAQIRTVRWMAEYYCCSLRQALSVFLPAGTWEALKPREEVVYRLVDREAVVRGKKQLLVIGYLEGKEEVTDAELKQETGASPATIKSLLEKGIINKQIKTDNESLSTIHYPLSTPSLTAQQTSAYSAIKASPKPSLLFGITGSGKTEVYAQLIADCISGRKPFNPPTTGGLAQGKQAILLVPEILLTEHCIHRFEELIDPEAIAVIHSRLTPAAKRNAWSAIARGEKKLIIGSRSALFAPVRDLGVVIIDEEHEWTYKNEQTPRYHARETAEKLCEEANARLVMGTATPSVEAWSRVKSGRYDMARLEERYGGAALPSVRVVDLATVDFGNLYPFSPPLLEAIDDRLKKGEQSVLFLNRRGLATALLCLDCRRRIVSPDSNLPFTVHSSGSGNPYLMDHTSGLRAELPASCPHCKSANLQCVGAGTQRIEAILERKFPNARILRADSDTLKHPEQMRLLLKKMRERQADILLGTQSVVKGLDLPGVTLAAVLIADVGLSLPHFRAGERTFQLLTQLTGRSGRRDPGEVIIQTFRPDAPEICLAAEHRTVDFLEQELKLRLHLNYPPATEMIRLIIKTPNAKQRAQGLAKQFSILNFQFSISCAPTLFGGGTVWHILIRGSNVKKALQCVQLDDVIVDCDPMDCV